MVQDNYTINKCIYCGGIGKTDEHIIPAALGGKRRLKKASCESCRVITSKCELNPLKENWEEARAVRNYPSSHRNLSVKKFPLDVILKDGSEDVLELSKDEALGLAIFLEYPLPAFFNPDNYKKGLMVDGTRLISFGSNTVEGLKEKYGLKDIKPKALYRGTGFGKMVAKIGYCAVIDCLGFDSLNKCFILPALLDKKDDIGFWMGCDHEGKFVPLIGKQPNEFCILLHIFKKVDDGTRYVATRLKFFAQSKTPEYIVVIGTLKRDFIIPDHLSIDLIKI